MFRKLLFVAPVVAVIAFAGQNLSVAQLAQQNIKHPRLHAALSELVKAQKELKDAGGGFGGHRQEALKSLGDAIESVRVILEVKGDNPNLVIRKPEFYRAYKNYPHMRQVILDLKEARSELQDAKANFGAHKQRAIDDINHAIKHVQLAIDHAGAQ